MTVYQPNSVFAGRYFLEEVIGEGGFSEVWRAHDVMADNSVVALKIYAPEKGLDDYGIRQFRQEFSITFHLSHPHLMKVYHFDVADGSPYLIMPYCSQGSIAKKMGEEGVFSEQQIALLMYQLGSALMDLHTQQQPILHQDIKPDNILILKDNHFILADFGISSNIRHTLKKSTTTNKALTVAYAPPERFDRSPVSNEAGDVFSLGVTLYEMCIGQIPWDGFGGLSLLRGANIPSLPASFPKELNKMLEACMASEWEKRPSPEQVMNWGKLFLEQGYWKYQIRSNSETSKLRKYALPVSAVAGIGGIALVSTLVLSGASFPFFNTNKNAVAEPVKVEESILEEKNTNSAFNKSYSRKGELESYINSLSNPANSRAKRKALKAETLSLFADSRAQVIDEKEDFASSYTAEGILNLLIDIPHKVKIERVETNEQGKITKLYIEMNPLIE